MINFTPRPLYPQARNPLNSRLDGLQSRPGLFGEETNVLFLPGTEPRYLSYPARSLVTIQTNICRLIKKNGKHSNHRGRVDSRIVVRFPARIGGFMGVRGVGGGGGVKLFSMLLSG